MIQLRARAAGITTKIGNHTFRATGVTAYLKNGGTLEKAPADGEPCQHAHDAALRSPRGGSDARRGGANTRLKSRTSMKSQGESPAIQPSLCRVTKETPLPVLRLKHLAGVEGVVGLISYPPYRAAVSNCRLTSISDVRWPATDVRFGSNPAFRAAIPRAPSERSELPKQGVLPSNHERATPLSRLPTTFKHLCRSAAPSAHRRQAASRLLRCASPASR